MSATKAEELLTRARRAGDPRAADQLATRAIHADPDLGAAYGLRGALAARRGDPIVAAHYLRVAYARGDRSEATRAGLAACLAAVGEDGVAGRVRAGARLSPALEDFAEGLAAHAGPLRGVLSARMPPAGQPALLPGERSPAPQGAARPADRPSQSRVGPPPARPSAGRIPAPAERPSQSRVGPPPSRPSAGRVAPPPPRSSTGGQPKVVRRSTHVRPDWLEPTRFEGEVESAPGERPAWLEDNTPPARAGGAFTGGGIELAADPGLPTVRVRSPITGMLIDEQVIARDMAGAAMPDIGAPADPLEARPALRDAVADPDGLALAVHLPGPVVTAAGGRNPRKLADRVALGLLTDELILRDGANPPARVPLWAIRRLDVLDDGAQLSLHLHDGRQMHLDLRDLKRRAPFVASRLVDLLAERL